MNFWGKLRKSWRRSHALFKAGLVCWVIFQAADYVLIYATPSAMWNGPYHFREQWIVVTGQAVSVLLMIVGGGLRLRQQIRAERKEHS